MTNKINSILLAIGSVLTLSLPVAADDPAQPPNVTNSGKPSSSGRLTGFAAKAPKAAASFLIGSLVGMPIAVVRYSTDEMSHAAKGMVRGVKANPVTSPFFLVVGPEAIMLGSLAGLVLGPTAAVEQSAANCWNKPFSKEAFSLGPMPESGY